MKKSELTKLLDELFDSNQHDGVVIFGRGQWHEVVGGVVEKLKKPVKKRDSSGSNYREYVSAWFDYFKRTNGISPSFGQVQGAALKQIRIYLEKESESPEQALATWKAILSNYHRLEDFYRLNADLKFINSQINKIITQLKHVTGKAKQGHNANDLRGQL